MSRPMRTILVGTSLEPGSDVVVASALEIARRSGARCHLFHAHQLPIAYFAAPTGLSVVSPELLDSERQVRLALAEDQLERIGGSRDVVGDIIVEAGAPHRMLLENARRLGADLLVCGACESDRLSILGSTADRVLRQATCPVWVVNGQPRLPPELVLAPVDLSPLAEDCLKRGLELLRQVCGLPPQDGAPRIETLFVLAKEEVEGSHQFSAEQIHRLANEELESFVQRLDPTGDLGLGREVREGEVRTEILRELEAEPVDLVLLGTHGRSGFERFLLGSVAADVAARSQVSVLILPPHEAAAAGG